MPKPLLTLFLQGAGWQYVAKFGRERSGDIGPPPGEYNFGAALNITAPYIGFSFQLQRLANDFGVQQWYQFVANLVLGELIRIQRALLDTTVDDNLATAFGTTGRRLSATDSGASSGLMLNLLRRIASRMGLSTQDLTRGLSALGVYNGPSIKDVVDKPDKVVKADKPAVKPAHGQKVKGDSEKDVKPATVEPAKTVTAAKGTKPTTPTKYKQSAQPQPASQYKKVVQATDEAQGDHDMLSQLDSDIQLMDLQAQRGMAAAKSKGL